MGNTGVESEWEGGRGSVYCKWLSLLQDGNIWTNLRNFLKLELFIIPTHYLVQHSLKKGVNVRTSFLQMIFDHDCTYHEDIANAPDDGKWSKQQQPRYPGPVWVKSDRRDDLDITDVYSVLHRLWTHLRPFLPKKSTTPPEQTEKKKLLDLTKEIYINVVLNIKTIVMLFF